MFCRLKLGRRAVLSLELRFGEVKNTLTKNARGRRGIAIAEIPISILSIGEGVKFNVREQC